MNFRSYETNDFYDELFTPEPVPREGARLLSEKLETLSGSEILRCQQAAELALLTMGITFNVHGSEAGVEKTDD